MLTEYNHPIHYELDINPLISRVVLDTLIYKQTLLLKGFFYFNFNLDILYIFLYR